MTKDEALKLALEALEIEEAQTHYPSQWLLKAITAIKEALAQPEQEPVGYWMGEFNNGGAARLYEVPQESMFGRTYRNIPLYTTPPQRTWVGLTDEEREEIALEVPMDAVLITEAKLKEKNT